MENLFLKVIDLSVDASFVIAFVLLVRLFLKRFPKIFSYVLWVVVFIRLIIPFSIESSVSIFGVRDTVVENIKTESVEYTPSTTLENYSPNEIEAVEFERENLETSYESKQETVTKKNFGIKETMFFIWIAGIGILIIHSIYSTIMLFKKLKYSEYLRENIYINKEIETAFVFGLFNPKIYRPYGLNLKEEEYILEHERVHLKRKDHLWKFLAFFITVIHWFNPLVWLSYYLMSLDMELSCDEAVVRKLGSNIKKDYSNSLLSFSTGKRILTASPLAFGEGNLKGRIKNILKYKRPKFWVIAVCLIFVIGTTVGCLTDKPTMSERDYADQYAKEFIETFYEFDSGLDGFEITKLEYKESFDYITDIPLELWEMDFKIKLKNQEEALELWGDKVIDGWITQEQVGTSFYLIFSRENGDLKFYGNSIFTSIQNETVSGRERGVRRLLEREEKIPITYYDSEYVVVNYTLTGPNITRETSRLLLSKPIRQDDSGIWVVERELDSIGRQWLPIFTPGDSNLQSIDNYKMLQEKVDSGEDTWRTDPLTVAKEYLAKFTGAIGNNVELETVRNASIEYFLDPPVNTSFGYYNDIIEDRKDGEIKLEYFNATWISTKDKNWINSLNLDVEKDMPRGYYINYFEHPELKPSTAFLNKDTIYKIVNQKNPEGEKLEVSFYEFKSYLENRKDKVFLILTSKGLETLEVEEVYLP